MRKIHIDNVVPGSKLAKSIFTSDGRVLLTSGMALSLNYIDRIRANSIADIFIEDDISEGIIVSDVVCEQTRVEAKVLVKNIMTNSTFSRALDTGRIREIVDRLIDDLLSNKDILINLSDIKSVDDYTFEHSVNVCILSLITGISLGYNILRIKDLGIGALLHDIGKLRIPEEILKKPSQLTVEEFEEIKKHTIYGYEVLKDNPSVSMISAFIAFGHHERYDGSGYPLQLKGENIHQCARIVAIADVYDALTSDRVYRKKLRPHEVVEYITSLGSHHFDKEIIENFVKYVAIYPIGTGVILSSKETGIVVGINKNMPTRPIVRIVYDSQKVKLKTFQVVDLSKSLNTFIIDSCEVV